MESNLDNDNEGANLSIGRRLWLKYFKWIIGGGVLLVAFIIWYITSQVKKNTLSKLAEDIPYPPDVTTPTQAQIDSFNEWVNTQGKGIVKRIGDELQSTFWINTSKIKDDVKILAQGSDKQLVWAYKYYRTQYVGKSLVTDLDRIVFTTFYEQPYTLQIIDRLKKLGAK